VKLNIVSCDRNSSAKLFSTATGFDEVHVFHDGTSAPSNDKITSTTCTSSLSGIGDNNHAISPPRWRATRSFMESISMHPGSVTVEEDTYFCRNVVEKLEKCIKSIPFQTYILSLYSPNTLADKPVDSVNPKCWYGSQGIFVPKKVAPSLCWWFGKKLVSKHPIDYSTDACIAEFCIQMGVPLFVCNPNLIQHLAVDGVCSAWANGKQHQSPTFLR